MKVLAIRHVEFEHLGNIAKYLKQKKIEYKYFDVWKEEKVKNLEEFSALIICGGYMGVYESSKYKFLKNTLNTTEYFLKKQKPILGICLGSQVLAHILSANVFRGDKKEIGFFDVFKRSEDELFGDFPHTFTAFHWHGDTFDLPKSAKLIFSSKMYENQGFVYEKAVGLQFHIEVSKNMVFEWAEKYREEIEKEKIDTKSWEKVKEDVFFTMEKLLFSFLEKFLHRI
jgi:GMP synthase-like glutamine amidotransferase